MVLGPILLRWWRHWKPDCLHKDKACKLICCSVGNVSAFHNMNLNWLTISPTPSQNRCLPDQYYSSWCHLHFASHIDDGFAYHDNRQRQKLTTEEVDLTRERYDRQGVYFNHAERTTNCGVLPPKAAEAVVSLWQRHTKRILTTSEDAKRFVFRYWL